MKMKLKYFYRIFGVMLTFVVIFNFFIGASDPFTQYNNLEELQLALPDYFYYFDFELENEKPIIYESRIKKYTSCFSKNSYGYNIIYNFEDVYYSNKIEYFLIEADACVTTHTLLWEANIQIDGIKCDFYYKSEQKTNGYYLYNLKTVFVFENIRYAFYIAIWHLENNKKEELKEYFFTIVLSAVENRYKRI